MKKSTRQWVSWAQQHARELGDAGMRHLERQDLLSERQRIYGLIGEEIAVVFVDEEKKSIRSDSARIADQLERVRAINSRLQELDMEPSVEERDVSPDTSSSEDDHVAESGDETSTDT